MCCHVASAFTLCNTVFLKKKKKKNYTEEAATEQHYLKRESKTQRVERR